MIRISRSISNVFDSVYGPSYRQQVMTRLRSVLRLLAIVCVCWQVVGLAASPAVLCVDVSRDSAVECTCAHGDHGMCPMHHSAPAQPRSKSDCSCRGTTDPAVAVLAAIIGPIAVVPERLALDIPGSGSAFGSQLLPQPLSPVLAPDGPPPRF